MNRTQVHLLIFSILPLLVIGTASAQNAKPSINETEIDEIKVIGTRSSLRSLAESPVPVSFLNATELSHPAAIQGEVGELISTLLPSALMSRNSNSDLADVVRTVRLKGLDPSHTLVLINGKRRHNISIVAGAAVDLNNIPTSSIKRIEVLHDGAAAQYGSDAIAGVINIVLKDASQGGSLSTTYGAHITDFEPTDKKITDGETTFISGNSGFILGDNGYLNISAEFRNREATNRAGAPDDLPFFENQTAPNLALTGKRNFRAGDSEFKDVNTMLNAQLPWSDTSNVYFFGSFSYREGQGLNFFRYPDSSANVPEIYPNGFLPITDTSQLDYAATTGVKGMTQSNWNWDTSLTYGANDFEFNMSNSVNASLGTASPTEFDVANYKYQNIIFNFDMSKPFHVNWLKNQVNVAYGIEYRHEIYETQSGDEASYIAGPLATTGAPIGVQGNGGLRPQDTVDESRDETAAYLDLESHISDKLLLAIASRFEYYSDFGETINGKLATRYELSKHTAVRASVNSGFRAPSLTQAFFKGGTTDFNVNSNNLVLRSFLSATDPIAQLLGAEELDPEQSNSYNFGFTFSTESRLNFTIDTYQINIDDRIVRSQTIGGTAVTDFINSNLGISNISTLTYFTNAIDTETKGVDIVADYTFSLTDTGTLNLKVAASHTQTKVKHVKDNPSVLSSLGISSTVLNSLGINAIERSKPRTTAVVSGNFKTDRLSVFLRASFFGHTEHNTPFGQQEHSSEWLLDMDVEYKLVENISIAIGGNNILDNYPDRTVSGNSYFGNFPYDIVAPISMNGAYYYGRISYHF